MIENDNKIIWESEQISGDASAYWKGEIKKGKWKVFKDKIFRF